MFVNGMVRPCSAAHSERQRLGRRRVLVKRPHAARQGLMPWIEKALQRMHRNLVAIALANKLARIRLGRARARARLSAEDCSRSPPERSSLGLTKRMDATPLPPPSLASRGERATVRRSLYVILLTSGEITM